MYSSAGFDMWYTGVGRWGVHTRGGQGGYMPGRCPDLLPGTCVWTLSGPDGPVPVSCLAMADTARRARNPAAPDSSQNGYTKRVWVRRLRVDIHERGGSAKGLDTS